MSEEIRKFVRKLNKSVLEYLSAPRRASRLPLVATLESGYTTGDLRQARKPLAVEGFTQDLSKTGIAFVVPFIRLGEYYLAGNGQRLALEIELPEAKIAVNVVAQRYEIIGQHDSVSSYLIGSKIVSMKSEDREILEKYLKYGSKSRKKPAEKEAEDVSVLQPNENSGSIFG
jgi:hypothetical protein